MVRIDGLIFGYRKIKINPEDLSKATVLMLRAGISSKFNYDGTITVRERDFAKIQTIFNGRIDFYATDVLGFYGKIKQIRHKKAVAIAVFLSILLTVFLSGIIWDIRVEGNENIPSAKIIYGLSECGFEIGNFWISTDRSDVETRFLINCDDISWININRRGTVAYVKVIEGNSNDDSPKENNTQYANVVAVADCVIEELTVYRGTAVVKVGDTVKKGDILISGVLPQEAGGGFCRAFGSVTGRVSDTVSVNVDRKFVYNEEQNRKLCSIDINLFNFRINIFKLYRNLTNECDIIEKKKYVSIFGKYKLPLSITTIYIPQYEIHTAEYTDDQLISVSSSRLNAMIATRLMTCDLLKMKTQGSFTDDGYCMMCEILFLSEVGSTMEFEID